MSKARKKKRQPKRVLALPDLEQSKAAVLNSLTSKSGQRKYDRAITDFVEWYCSEPRLAFNRTVVLPHRIYLEQRPYAATTISLRLAAVRRVAFEAADSGLLSPDWPPAYDGSKEFVGLECASGTGLVQNRANGWWEPQSTNQCAAREITPCS